MMLMQTGCALRWLMRMENVFMRAKPMQARMKNHMERPEIQQGIVKWRRKSNETFEYDWYFIFLLCGKIR